LEVKIIKKKKKKIGAKKNKMAEKIKMAAKHKLSIAQLKLWNNKQNGGENQKNP
jgi:hypothetical protein